MKKPSEVDRVFSEGEPAIYMVLQLTCPECSKIFRLSFLADSKSIKVTS